VKPATFRYAAPRSLEGCLALLSEHGDEARILAGGQSLVPMMNLRLATPDVLVDINELEECSAFSARDGELSIGAIVRQRELEASIIVEGFPLLAQAGRNIAHPQIRNRGTIVGSLAHNDPAAELPAAALVYDATVELRSVDGTRRVAADEFIQPMFTTVTKPTELVYAVHFPRPPEGSGEVLLEFARRQGDFAIVGVACRVIGSGDEVDGLRLATFGVGLRAERISTAEQSAIGRRAERDLWHQLALLTRDAVAPQADVHATTEFRRHLTQVLTERALALAWGRVLDGRLT
jgi:aerobic carbon-monoxide dehydrogenase medium subunit